MIKKDVLNTLFLLTVCLPHFFPNILSAQTVSESSLPMALNGKILLENGFINPQEYTAVSQQVVEGWNVKTSHAVWKKTNEGVQSIWTAGHMPVLAFEGGFNDAVIEVDFRFKKEPGKWAACRISPTNPALNPRAYAASVWANANGGARQLGMVLEHDEWKPGVITTVDRKQTPFESDIWYTVRMELIGNTVQATCNGVTVFGTHPKFGIPKTSIYLGVGTCPHELRNFKVYQAIPNPAWNKFATKLISFNSFSVKTQEAAMFQSKWLQPRHTVFFGANQVTIVDLNGRYLEVWPLKPRIGF